MTDKPQLMTEEIELIPHPMDAWRAALNALIACAPGDSAAIAVHLAEARQQALVFVDRTTATEGTRKLVDRLMLIGAGRIVGEQLKREATRANGKCLLTDSEAEIISQDLVAAVRRHHVEPRPSPSGCAATEAQNGQCTSHQGQRTAHQCAVAAPLPSIEPAPQEQPASPQSPSRTAHVAQRFLAVDRDRS
ncbi:TPA: hypothetical protein SL832_005174 [Pseudomonas aeruginosa]|nr:hypothetical protein [Pseudomonas aeruginosa]